MRYQIKYQDTGTTVEPLKKISWLYSVCDERYRGFTLSEARSILIQELQAEIGILKGLSDQEFLQRYQV